MQTAVIILAAGQGTRMQSDLPKVLHKIGDAPMLWHALRYSQTLTPEKTVVVVGHGGAEVAKASMAFDPEITIAEQTERLGTGHAVAQAMPALDGFEGNVVILYGDTPFITEDTLQNLIEVRETCDLVVLGFNAENPGKYGRLITEGVALKKIVEFKDASDEERDVTFCNSGVMSADAAWLRSALPRLSNQNASGEYYLTDLVEIANTDRKTCGFSTCDESETLGVNSRNELATAEQVFQRTKRTEVIENGVTIPAPDTVIFAFDTMIGRDATIEPYVVFSCDVSVESRATIRAFSHLESCHIGEGAIVGPYARIRPGTEIAGDARVGNFVEIKNATLAQGAKVNHLSYIGDATIGERTNVGAGTITCNYDGVNKHHTEIGADTFVGSNTMLVAPVKMGDNAMSATGTVVTNSVPDGAMAIGRARQENKDGLAIRLFKKLRAQKANQKS